MLIWFFFSFSFGNYMKFMLKKWYCGLILKNAYLDESCSSTTKLLLGGEWFSVLMPSLRWLLFMWLLSLLLCCLPLSVLLWMTPDGIELWLWLSFGIRFSESVCDVDVETAVIFKSVNLVSAYIEYGDLKISHPMFANERAKNSTNHESIALHHKLLEFNVFVRNCERIEACSHFGVPITSNWVKRIRWICNIT